MKRAIVMMLAAVEGVIKHTAGNPAIMEQHDQLEEAYGLLHAEMEKQQAEEDLWQEMIRHYGAEAQMNAFVEEIGEVLQAQNKMRRDDTAATRDHLAEELIDVEVLLQQMKLLVPPESVENWKRQKLERIRQRLAKSKLSQAQNLARMEGSAGGLQNLFNALHYHGVIATQDEMLQIMEAMKKDLSLAEQEEFIKAPEGEHFHLAHNGQNFVPAEEEMEVTEAEDVNPNSYEGQRDVNT